MCSCICLVVASQLSLMGAFGYFCRPSLMWSLSCIPRHSDRVPAGPADHFQAPGSLWSSQPLSLGVPFFSRKLSWKSPCKTTLDSGRWALHDHQRPLGNTQPSPTPGGTAVGSQTSDSALWPQPTLPFSIRPQSAIPPMQRSPKSSASLSLKPFTCALEALHVCPWSPSN